MKRDENKTKKMKKKKYAFPTFRTIVLRLFFFSCMFCNAAYIYPPLYSSISINFLYEAI